MCRHRLHPIGMYAVMSKLPSREAPSASVQTDRSDLLRRIDANEKLSAATVRSCKCAVARERTKDHATLGSRIERLRHVVTEVDRTSMPRAALGNTTLADWLNLSHELRTPANAILGHAELLLSGAIGPLSSEMRASVGDIQKAGLGLLAQIQTVIEAGQAFSEPGASSAEIAALADRLGDCWLQAKGVADTAIAVSCEQQGQPTGPLRIAAVLLHDMDVTWIEPDAGSTLPASACRPDTRRHPGNALRLQCSVLDRPDRSVYFSVIEAVLAMTGGRLDRPEQDMLVVSWPVEESSAPSPCIASDETVQAR